ncbi:flagellar basal body-associated FliL family protein [uncultured Desulfuromonas sp.]|uniref:flagellar basal body-associated FliL family protein n=1 Tax=uncultured Desulfuromonas sp. TaxID=181013 RepID=UPI00261F8AE6|nr:flagellar basal body-associated FliL family protein [uncultured Desulfuromonas sp.]
MSENKEESKGAKGSKKFLLIIVVALVLAVGAGVGGFLLGSSGGDEKAAGEAAGSAEASQDQGTIGPLVGLDDFIVNLLDEQETRYLKSAITLELSGPLVGEEVQNRMPQIRDAILLLIGSKTFGELYDLQGKLQLRAELVSRINDLLKAGKVKKLYFTEFVIQ